MRTHRLAWISIAILGLDALRAGEQPIYIDLWMGQLHPDDRRYLQSIAAVAKPITVSLRSDIDSRTKVQTVDYSGPLSRDELQDFMQYALGGNQQYWSSSVAAQVKADGDTHRLRLSISWIRGELDAIGYSMVFTSDDGTWSHLYTCCSWIS
jgi:hypothetical protein